MKFFFGTPKGAAEAAPAVEAPVSLTTELAE
jgi:hypothetical protein